MSISIRYDSNFKTGLLLFFNHQIRVAVKVRIFGIWFLNSPLLFELILLKVKGRMLRVSLKAFVDTNSSLARSTTVVEKSPTSLFGIRKFDCQNRATSTFLTVFRQRKENLLYLSDRELERERFLGFWTKLQQTLIS